ncbi:transcriptional repressor NrdR [Candidatus Woesearchaeota archaeon]|mgnify:CR=1 FL=1|jgi:transcriptional repressor NrdR|nr:transcriptional repressor NrdR [Candidatus Woesearchaeota archaeon]
MYCPFCQKETKVIDSRISDTSVKRRRECLNCQKRFSTQETPQLTLLVTKKDSTSEEFSPEKIHRGISKAFNKRPFTEEQIKTLSETINSHIFNNHSQITTKEIGKIVAKKIKQKDSVAYLRFISVYHSFDNLEKFKEELTKLENKKTRSKK